MIDLGSSGTGEALTSASAGEGASACDMSETSETSENNTQEVDYRNEADRTISESQQYSLPELQLANDEAGETLVKDGNKEDTDVDFFEADATEDDPPEQGGAADGEACSGSESTETTESEGGNSTATEGAESSVGEDEQPVSELTAEEKAKIKEETGWSDEVIDHIKNMEQYKILKDAGLKEQVVDGKICLVKENIDLDYVDPKTGMTNRERMEKGRPPIDPKTGEKIELHHLGQDKDGPLVELTQSEHRGPDNHAVLHPETSGSWRHEEGSVQEYEQERKQHWQERAKEDDK